MADNYIISELSLTNIGDAIREQLGETDKYRPDEMPAKIREIEGDKLHQVEDPEILDQYKTTKGIDSIYEYEGEPVTGDRYQKDRLYRVVEKIFTITTNCTHCDADPTNPTTISSTETKVLKFTPWDVYAFNADSCVVTGASATWNHTTGEVTISNAVNDVVITVTAEQAECNLNISAVGVDCAEGSFVTVDKGSAYTLHFTPQTGFMLPSAVSVSGIGVEPEYVWSRDTGELLLTNIRTDIIVSVVGYSFTGLTFTALVDNSNLKFTKVGNPNWSGEYSLDDGATWVAYPEDTGITLNAGETVCIRGILNSSSPTDHLKCVMTGGFDSAGNILSLGVGENYKTSVTVPCNYAFYGLFEDCTVLQTPPDLPPTHLSIGCYQKMFKGCTNMYKLPAELPSDLMLKDCYTEMFSGCTNIYVSETKVVPAYDIEWIVPKRGIGSGNYTFTDMFLGCKGTRTTDSPNYDDKQVTYYIPNLSYTFNVTYNLTNITGSPTNPAQIPASKTAIMGFTANTGWELPTEITVTGCEYEWNSLTGALMVKNIANDIVITMDAVKFSGLCFTAAEENSTVALNVDLAPEA